MYNVIILTGIVAKQVPVLFVPWTQACTMVHMHAEEYAGMRYTFLPTVSHYSTDSLQLSQTKRCCNMPTKAEKKLAEVNMDVNNALECCTISFSKVL